MRALQECFLLCCELTLSASTRRLRPCFVVCSQDGNASCPAPITKDPTPPPAPPQPATPPEPPAPARPLTTAAACARWPAACPLGAATPCVSPTDPSQCGSARPDVKGLCVNKEFVFCGAPPPPSPPPPANMTMLFRTNPASGQVYAVSTDNPLFFQDRDGAEETCRSLGGRLATISTPAEAQFVSQIVPPSRVSWIGLTADEGTPGLDLTWRWEEGYPMSFDAPWCAAACSE